jgi:hypothetical protein
LPSGPVLGTYKLYSFAADFTPSVRAAIARG